MVLEKEATGHIAGESGMAKSLPAAEPKTTAKFHLRLLLAEDDPIIQESATVSLNMLGYSCDVVNNGREAIQALSEKDYDLVLLDCRMPEMDGFEAAGIIRDPESMVRNHAVPVIAVTGGAAPQTSDPFLAAGMNDYLAKPYCIGDLQAVLDKWLPNSPQHDGDEASSRSDIRARFEADDAVRSLFIAKAPEYVAALKSSVKEGNTEGVRHHAHKLAGAAAAIGASDVAGLAAEMEKISYSSEMSNAEQKQQQLAEAFDILQALLTREVS
jgi:two-component system, sensor histidine kinase and response regulator